jgi:hypothetical protein
MGELPGCPKPLILKAVVEVLREWCYRTQAWEVDLNDINVVADQTSYDLQSHIPDTEIVSLVYRPSDDKGVHLDGRLLSPGVDYTIPVDKDVIVLKSTPTAAITDGLTITAALRPVRGASASVEVPERLFDDWHQDWARGIMSRLMLMDGEEWSNPDRGSTYDSMYWDGIRLAIAERTRGRTNRPLRVQHPSTWP